jgi:predicted glutamine amidotransferase
MCIAISKPQGFTLTEETLQECWKRNPDGAGFMYTHNNQLQIVKGLMTYKEFSLAYEPHQEKACVLHFRIKTHGATNEENTHPFLIDKGLGMVHNGILNSVDTTSDNTMSDTWHFATTHLHRFRRDNKRFYLNPLYKELIESYISYSKLIFMDNQGNVEIFNESKGVWDSGCWFSNTSYKVYVQPTPKKTKAYRGYWDVKTRSWVDNDPEPTKVIPFVHKKSEDNPRSGDFCKTTATVVTEDGTTIPIGSYVRITYFTTTHWVGIKEVATGLTAELTLAHLTLIPRTSKMEPQNDTKDLPIQTLQ